MELIKNIFFNTDKLTPNSEVKISYTGKFFQDDSEEVYMHYGFGNNWDNVNDIKMEKSDLGYQATITLLESDSFSFCFKNNDNNWDNNDGNNYIFPIEAKIIIKKSKFAGDSTPIHSAKKRTILGNILKKTTNAVKKIQYMLSPIRI